MSAFDWFLVAWWVLNLVVMVNMVNKPRKPIEPPTAAIACLIYLAFITALLFSRGAL